MTANTKNNQLAADSVSGVFRCENPSNDVLIDMAFYSALDSCGADTIYGRVSDEIAAKIEADYGVH